MQFAFVSVSEMDSVMKGLMGQCAPHQNFWVRTARECNFVLAKWQWHSAAGPFYVAPAKRHRFKELILRRKLKKKSSRPTDILVTRWPPHLRKAPPALCKTLTHDFFVLVLRKTTFPQMEPFGAGAVLVLARWGQWGHNSCCGAGGTICSWIKDITGLFKWKSRETGPKWGPLGSHFSLESAPYPPRTAPDLGFQNGQAVEL